MRKRYSYILMFLGALFLIAGCGNEKDCFIGSDVDLSQPVVFGASIKDPGKSRGVEYKAGPVETGVYNLTFLNSGGVLETGELEFIQGVGYGKQVSQSSTVDLLWENVGPVKMNGVIPYYSFYIDNLDAQYRSETPEVMFSQDANPYHLQQFVADADENADLVWGGVEEVNRANIISVDLHHVMSRFKIRIRLKVKDRFPEKSTMTNLFQYPVGFDRTTGSLSLPETPEATPFEMTAETTDWATDYDEENDEYIYSTPDFILPPQQFVSNMRPRLSVTLSTGESYSGYLPLAMNLIDEDGALTPWNMEFRRGYCLVMDVTLSNIPGELKFMPVSVYDWYPKGEYTISGIEAQINSDGTLKEMIKAYNKGDETTFYPWGYHQTEGDDLKGWWVFNIYQNFRIFGPDFNETNKNNRLIYNEDLPFEFDLHLATITVELPGNTEVEISATRGGQDALKTLIIEGLEAFQNLIKNGKLPEVEEKE